MRTHILFALIGGFLVGVFIRSFVPIGSAFIAFAALLAAAALLLIGIGAVHRGGLVVAVAFLALAGGIARMDTATLSENPVLTAHLGKKVTIEAIVTDEPDVRDGGVRLSLRVERLITATSTVAMEAGVLALVPPHADVSYGDRVRVTGMLRLPEAFDAGLGRQFRYPEFLAKDGIAYQLAFAQVDARESSVAAWWPKQAALWLKRHYLAGLRQSLPEPEAGLAGGITVGDKRSIGAELSEDFRRASLIHMVVLSGYNITVVINFIRWLLQTLPHGVQYSGLGTAVLLFVLMSGGAASAVRAGIMALVAVFARATGRVYLAGRILSVVAFCMVLWNPMYLAFDPSFQLSILATLGLIVFTPIFAERLQWLTERFGLREIAASTLGTQLAVLPLLLYQSGQLSLVAFPANLLALLPIPLAMSASFLAAFGGLLAGPLAPLIAFPAYLLLAYVVEVAEFFAALPFAAVSVPAFSAWWLVLIYGALLFWASARPSREVVGLE